MKLREVLLIGFIVFLFVVGVFGWIMLRETIVSTGLYLGIIAIPAVIAGVIIGMRMGRVTGFTNTLINILFTAVSLWILIGSGLIALNFFTARSSEGEIERAIIEKKFTQTRYRTELEAQLNCLAFGNLVPEGHNLHGEWIGLLHVKVIGT